MLSRKLDVIVSLVAMAAVLQVNAADSVAHSRSATNNTLHLPIPNPYPMPYTPYSIEFDGPGPSLPSNEVVECIFRARHQILRRIHSHGGDEGFRPREYRYRTIIWGLAPLEGPTGGRLLTWADANAVLLAFSLKLHHEGHRQYWARIFQTEGGQVVGTAVIGSAPEAISSDSS